MISFLAFFFFRSVDCGINVNPRVIYQINLRSSGMFFDGSNAFSVAADCDEKTGKLKSGFIILRKNWFYSLRNGGRKGYIHTCPCDSGWSQHERLGATSKEVDEDFVEFCYREQQNQCIHAASLDQLFPTILDVYNANSESTTEQPTLEDGMTMISKFPFVHIDICGLVNYAHQK